jgi:hypothetical protein
LAFLDLSPVRSVLKAARSQGIAETEDEIVPGGDFQEPVEL